MKRSKKKIKDAKWSDDSANLAGPHSFQVVFVDTNGTKTNGPLIEMSQKPERRRKLDDAAWSRDQTIHLFCKHLQSEDCDGLEAAMRAMSRLDCWCSAIDALRAGPSPNIERGLSLLSFWNDYGAYSVGRGLKEGLSHLVDTFKYLLPPYLGEGLMLYRGEVESRHMMGVYGISWTPIFEKARQFAIRRWPDEGRGVVLKMEATANMIVAAVKDYSEHTLKLGEDE